MSSEQLAAEHFKHLKAFLKKLEPDYEQYAEALHSKFPSEEHIAKAGRDDLTELKIPKGAAGAILPAAKNSGAFLISLLHTACASQSLVQAPSLFEAA